MIEIKKSPASFRCQGFNHRVTQSGLPFDPDLLREMDYRLSLASQSWSFSLSILMSKLNEWT